MKLLPTHPQKDSYSTPIIVPNRLQSSTRYLFKVLECHVFQNNWKLLKAEITSIKFSIQWSNLGGLPLQNPRYGIYKTQDLRRKSI